MTQRGPVRHPDRPCDLTQGQTFETVGIKMRPRSSNELFTRLIHVDSVYVTCRQRLHVSQTSRNDVLDLAGQSAYGTVRCETEATRDLARVTERTGADTGRSGGGRADVVRSADHLDGIRAICERFGVGAGAPLWARWSR